MNIEFYKETTDDFYPSYELNTMSDSSSWWRLACKVMYGNLDMLKHVDGRFCICVSGVDDYMLTKISTTSLNIDLYTILETPVITKDLLKSLGFTE